MSDHSEPGSKRSKDFESRAERAAASSAGPIREFWNLLSRSGKWWMLPIVLSLLTVGALLVLSSTALAPLIYTLF